VKTRKLLSLLVAMFLIAGLSSGCRKKATPTGSPATPVTPTGSPGTPIAMPMAQPSVPATETDTIVVLVAEAVDSLEPYRMVGVHPEGSIASHIWDALTWLNDDLEIEPHVAESWHRIDDLTWEFALRPDVTFHNGEPLDAEAVRFSIGRSGSLPGSTETFAGLVDLDRVIAVSDHVVRITTRQPTPDLPYHLAFLEILPPGHYLSVGPDQAGDVPVGSGPYRVGEWIPGQALTLEAVPAYWKGAPRWSRIVFRVAPNLQERLRALRTKVQLVTDLAPIKAARWDLPGTRLETIESTTRMLVGIHSMPGTPLGDRRVRQALNYGLDVDRLVGEWLEGYGQRYGSWVNPPGNNSTLAPWPYDPDRSRELLTEAGYPDGFVTTLTTPNGAYYQDVALARSIAQQWAEIGVTVEVKVVEWAAYTERLLSDDPPPLFLLAMNSRGNALEDVRNLLPDWPYNPTGWHSLLFAQQLRLAARTFDPRARSALLHELQALAYDEAPWIWLWRQYCFYGVDQRLDWTPRRDGLVYLYEPASN